MTLTVRVSAEQAKLLEGWIAAGKELDRIVAEMQQMSMVVTELMLQRLPPPRRKAPAKRRHPKGGAAG